MGPLTLDFLDIYLTTFSEYVISEIQKLWGSSFFSNCTKLNLDFKNSEKSFFFWENCISIGIVKLSLLWTGYFSSAANVLTGCPKIFHVNQRNFFQLNWLGSDHWKWQRCCDADLKSTSGSLPCCFSKVPLKRDFSDIYLTTFRSP